MRIHRLLILFIVMGLTVFSFLQGEEKLKKISLEEVLSIGSLESDILYMWAGITTGPQGHIYVTDAMDYSVKKFNEKGVLVKKVGRKGKGPKEFLAPRSIKYFQGQLYVTDQYIPGIKIFDKNLNYIRHIPLKFPIWDLKIASEEKIFISSPIMSQPEQLILIDSQGKMNKQMKQTSEVEEYWENFLKFEIDVQGNLYVIYTFRDRIRKYNRTMNQIWAKSLFGHREVKRKKLNSSKVAAPELPTQTAYKDIALDSQGHLFILGGHLCEHPGRDVYVLDQKGNHLTSFLLPESSHCLHIDHHDFLYSRGEEGTSIKKISMKYIYGQ
ncbi:hypothetical protein KGY73_08315 [bacterium]|nr:hypothetical protein [bacterium]